MSDGIKISKKHGVNPTMAICAWCGEHKGEIALLGELPGDVKAPREAIVDYEPCDKCKEQWTKGVVYIEVSEEPQMPNQPEITEGLYPTGTLVVVAEDALDDGFVKGDAVLMHTDIFRGLFNVIYGQEGNLQ